MSSEPPTHWSVRSTASVAESISNVWTHFVARQFGGQLGAGVEVGPHEVDGYNLLDVLNEQSQGRIRASLDNYADHERTIDTMVSFHHLARWRQFGFPTFRVTHGLAASLVLTDCADVRGRDVEFPFDSLCIDLPQPNELFRIVSAARGVEVPARFARVHVYDAVQGAASVDAANEVRRLTREAKRAMLERRDNDARPLLQRAVALAPSIQTARRLRISLAADDSTEVHFARNIPEGEADFEAVLVGAGEPTDGLESVDSNALRAAARLVVNLCLWLAEPSNPQPWRTRGPRARTLRPGAEPTPTTWVVGQAIKLPRQFVDAARAYAATGTTRAAWKVQSRWVTCGHWRNQSHGPRHSLRRKQWIKPHWNGPVDGPALTRLYKAGLPDDAPIGGAT